MRTGWIYSASYKRPLIISGLNDTYLINAYRTNLRHGNTAKAAELLTEINKRELTTRRER